jgi:hypothetical protein
MNQPEPGPASAGALMMGPDGAIYRVPAGPGDVSRVPGAADAGEPPVTGDTSERAGAPADADDSRGPRQPLPGIPRMPVVPCFSYGAGPPSGTGHPGAAQRALPRLPVWACFSYGAGPLSGIGDRAGRTPPDQPQLPGTHCFRY